MFNETEGFFAKAEYLDSPFRVLTDFLEKEVKLEEAGKYDDMRFVGYVLDLGFEDATIITSDPFKKAVGGVPRGSYLIMAPDSLEGMPPHFTLLRVTATAPTPLSKDVQQTYFELHKKSMPDLDIWTKGELQWGALSAKVLGMYFPDGNDCSVVKFSGDVNNVVSAHRYKVFSPTDELLDMIVNGIVRKENQFGIGKLRLTECDLPFANSPKINVPVNVSTNDFRGFRTAMFGKTRLGKSNVVKIIAKSIIETTQADRSVGQLIFDVNGEYANDNPQDGNKSLRSAYSDRCEVYALSERPGTPSKPLKLNFYEQPDSCMGILRSLLEHQYRGTQYVSSFYSAQLPNLNELKGLSPGSDRSRGVRKIQLYWAILSKAGFKADEGRLKALRLTAGTPHGPSHFDPHFNKKVITAVYGSEGEYQSPASLDELVAHLEKVQEFRLANKTNADLKKLFDADDESLLDFFSPSMGGGPKILRPFMSYHSPHAGNFVYEILGSLDHGRTVILDLGNAGDEIRRYFSDLLSSAVFSHQEKKFTSNSLGKHFIQLYFEEAHNLFPKDDREVTGVYARFAKEGAKFHIGMVYSTQSPSTINRELLAQTENFLVAHMSSQVEVDALAKLQIQFNGLQADILRTRTPGYMRMITFSHRFVVPVQVNKFEVV
ncbi:ATP-binding protein [Microbulbifer sp. EKSA008]|uniref:ATP-binding protein n=1 Tax=Microbulbifer sp. EKSA008 TaxID=3243367 RepID=UPI0040433EC1